MNHWKFLAISAAIFITTLLLFYVYHDEVFRQKQEYRLSRIMPLPGNSIVGFDVETKDTILSVKKWEIGGWVTTAPHKTYANHQTVKTFLDILQEKPIVSTIPIKSRDDLDKYQLKTPAYTLRAKTDDPSYPYYELNCGLTVPSQQIAYCWRNFHKDEVISIQLAVYNDIQPAPKNFMLPKWFLGKFDWDTQTLHVSGEEKIVIKRKGEDFYIGDQIEIPVDYDKLYRFLGELADIPPIGFSSEKPANNILATLEQRYSNGEVVSYSFFRHGGSLIAYNHYLSQGYKIPDSTTGWLEKTTAYFTNPRIIVGSEHEVKSVKILSSSGEKIFSNSKGTWSGDSPNPQAIFQILFYVANMDIDKQSPLTVRKNWSFMLTLEPGSGTVKIIALYESDPGIVFDLTNKQVLKVDVEQWELLVKTLKEIVSG